MHEGLLNIGVTIVGVCIFLGIGFGISWLMDWIDDYCNHPGRVYLAIWAGVLLVGLGLVTFA